MKLAKKFCLKHLQSRIREFLIQKNVKYKTRVYNTIGNDHGLKKSEKLPILSLKMFCCSAKHFLY